MPRKPDAPTLSTPGDRLRDARIALGLSQTSAAAIIGIHLTTYRQYETGRRRATLDQLHRFAEALGIDPRALDARLASRAGA